MTFTHIKNIDIANYALAVMEIKTRLKAAGWTIQDSGDGEVTIGLANGIYGNGTDILTVANTGGGYIANNIANRLAWWRIRSPAGVGGPEILFYHAAFNPGSDAFGGILIPACVGTGTWAGANSANYGTPPAGSLLVPFGTSSNPPSNLITDQWTDVFDGDAATARKMDFAIGDASEGYAWYGFTRTAARRIYRGWAMDYIKSAVRNPGDVHGHVLIMTYTSFDWTNSLGSARTSWGPYSGLNTGGENGSGPAQFATDEGDPLNTEPILNRRGRVSHVILGPMTCNVTGNQGTDLGLNPYNGLADVWLGSSWYYRSNYPEDFTGRGSPRFAGLKGKSTLFCQGGGGVADMAVANGQNLVAQGTGRVWVVWDATVPLDPGGGAITAAINVNAHTFWDVAAYNDMTTEPAFEHATTTPISFPANDSVTFVQVTTVPSTVTNRVWDTIAGRFVTWATGQPDVSGANYPGPGTFGIHTLDFCISADSCD